MPIDTNGGTFWQADEKTLSEAPKGAPAPPRTISRTALACG